MKRVGSFRVFNLNTALYKLMSLAREVSGCLRGLHGMIEPPYPFFDSSVGVSEDDLQRTPR
jgi:hypothetical protein